MSDKNSQNNVTPIEFPSRNQKIVTDPIVDVVNKELNPPHINNAQVEEK